MGILLVSEFNTLMKTIKYLHSVKLCWVHGLWKNEKKVQTRLIGLMSHSFFLALCGLSPGPARLLLAAVAVSVVDPRILSISNHSPAFFPGASGNSAPSTNSSRVYTGTWLCFHCLLTVLNWFLWVCFVSNNIDSPVWGLSSSLEIRLKKKSLSLYLSNRGLPVSQMLCRIPQCS